jgi:hypothetical protein
LIPSDKANQSVLDNFTGDHKLKNFQSKLQITEKAKLRLADYLVTTTVAN